MKKYNNNSWYSIILALLMVGFMLIITIWIFRLVLIESKDTRWMENYLKAFAWAEWSVELALLKSKESNYSINDEINFGDEKSKILATDRSDFFPITDVEITYELDSLSNEIQDTLKSWWFHIIPLSWYDDSWFNEVSNVFITWLNNEVVWNILWADWGISWVWDFTNTTPWNYRIISWLEVEFQTEQIWTFLSSSNNNYLILHNTSSWDVNYIIQAWPLEYLTKTKAEIIWSGKIWDYKQNLRVEINSWEYLNLLKYSLFSN